jgi:outer membrane protein assembly factor BamB
MSRPHLIALLAPLAVLLPARAENWPGWRGPTGQGVSADPKLPLKWSAKENVAWKIPLPDVGNSTPVVWGDAIFLSQATDGGKKRSLWCLDRADGKARWERTVEFAAEEPKHATNTYCAGSPATDGERVVVSHGSAGVFCYDLAGKELWRRDFGPCHHIWGSSSTPVIHRNLVYLNFGPHEKTFLVALDKVTGAEVWKADEPGKAAKEYFGSWSTPVVAEVRGRDELLMSWPGVVKAYDPAGGSVLWTCRGLEKEGGADRLTYASPLVSGDTVFAAAGFGGAAVGIKSGGVGDVTDSHRLWRVAKNPQRIGSGVIVGDHAYVVNESGPACVELKTGKTLWEEKIPGGAWGSIVRAGDRLYLTGQTGVTLVFAARPGYEELARNPLDGATTRASIVPADGAFLVRTYKHLWCVGAGR